MILIAIVAAQDIRDAEAGSFARLWGSAAWEYLRGPLVAGDFDGDGLADAAVANAQGAALYYDAGEVQIVPAELLSGDFDLQFAPVNLHGPTEHDYVGTGAAAYPNDDGPDGIVIGVDHSGLTEYDQGQVIYFDAPGLETGWVSAEEADLVIRGDDSADLFGNQVLNVSDLNGDDVDDWVFTAPARDNSFEDAPDHTTTNQEAGRVWIAFGNFARATGAVNAAEVADSTITGGEEKLFTGWSVCGAGDLDGDSLPDLVVGTLDKDDRYSGELLIFTGIAPEQDVLTSAAVASWTADSPGAYAGEGLACGDPDADGIPDVYVGAPNRHAGAGHVWHLAGMPRGREPMDAAAIEQREGSPGSGFGSSVALGPRLLVGAPFEDEVAVLGFDLDLEHTLAGPEFFGFYVGWPGDLDGDGVSDAAMVARDATGSRENQGVALLVRGIDIANGTTPLVSGEPVDQDADGVTSGDDCDDLDPRRFPGGEEVCKDDLDNDCDLTIDERPCRSGGCASAPAPVGALVTLLAVLGLRRRFLLLPLLLACRPTPELKLDLPDGPLSGPVDITATGNFDRIGVLVDGFTLGSGDGPAFSSTWDTRGVEPGDHVITAIAFEGAADPVEVSREVTVDQGAGDVLPPDVTFLSPTDGETLPGDAILIALNVEEESGVALMTVLANDAPLASIPPEGPYELLWENVPNGDYVLTAQATDIGGNVGEASLSIIVSDLAAVECTISKPEEKSTVSGDVQIKVGAGSAAGITAVEFYINDTSIGIDTASTWDWLWTSDPYFGEDVTIRVVCSAADGGSGTDEILVTVGEVVTKPFSVTLQQPTEGATINGAAFPVQAAIGGGEGPDHAELYVDDVLLLTDTATPWQWTIDTTALTNASHVVKVVGYEATTGATAEDSATVTVSN